MPGAPMRDVPKLSIVIPAHNEALRIGPTLRGYCQKFSRGVEIIVVINGSTDHTERVVQEVERVYPRIVHSIIIHEASKGRAVREGFLAAGGEVVGFVDADGATTPDEFQRLYGLLGTADGIIASRWIRGARVHNRSSLLRRIASWGFVLLAHLLFRLPYRDTQCGAKIFRRRVINAVAAQLVIKDMAFDVELLLRARHAGFTVTEAATTWTDQKTSYSRPDRFLKTSLGVFRSLINLRRLAAREHFL